MNHTVQANTTIEQFRIVGMTSPYDTIDPNTVVMANGFFQQLIPRVQGRLDQALQSFLNVNWLVKRYLKTGIPSNIEVTDGTVDATDGAITLTGKLQTQ